MTDDRAGKRVELAISSAVRRIFANDAPTYGRHKWGTDLRRRLSGTYGAELRQLADSRPDLSTEDLVAVVIAPTEFPWVEDAEEMAARINSSARDRTRKARYGPIGDFPDAPPPDLAERVAELRSIVAAAEITYPPPLEPDPDALRVVPPSVREALVAGRAKFAGRKT